MQGSDDVRDVVLPLVSDALAEDRRRAIKGVEVHSPFGVQKTDFRRAEDRYHCTSDEGRNGGTYFCRHRALVAGC